MTTTTTSAPSSTSLSRRGFVLGAAATATASLLAGCAATGANAAPASTDAEASAGTGTANGRNGQLTLRAIVKDGTLEDLAIVRSHETLRVGAAAQDLLHDLIVSGQTLNVDAVSGATLTSMAYLSAAEQALAAAGIDPKEWKKRDKAVPIRDEELPSSVDVVVVGSGGAGLCAAVTAAQAGASVLVLEKLGAPGGSTALSGAGFAAPQCWPQQQKGIEDSPEAMAQDMLVGGDNLGDPQLVELLCDQALDCFQWLSYDASLAWLPGVVQDGGHSVARSLNPVDYGAGLIDKLAVLAEASGVRLACNVKVDGIAQNAAGETTGVSATDLITGETRSIVAGAVVIATGGFGRNVEMRSQYDPALVEGYLCTDSPGATGDGLLMAQAAGAPLVNMEYIQTHPIGNPISGSMLDVGGVRVEGCAVMVNKEGARFVEELDRRDVVSAAIMAQTDSKGYFVFTAADAEAMGLYDWAADEVASLRESGLWAEGDTLEDACAPFGIDADELQTTLDTWNGDCTAGSDSQFGYRAAMSPIGDGPYCIFACAPTVHYTMGGVPINADAAVLDDSGSPIPHLFAAGEVTGNIMGTNRLGTTAVVDIVAFGRIAGARAARA